MDNNELNLQIKINGIPKLEFMPKEIFDALISNLAIELKQYYEKETTQV